METTVNKFGKKTSSDNTIQHHEQRQGINFRSLKNTKSQAVELSFKATLFRQVDEFTLMLLRGSITFKC